MPACNTDDGWECAPHDARATHADLAHPPPLPLRSPPPHTVALPLPPPLPPPSPFGFPPVVLPQPPAAYRSFPPSGLLAPPPSPFGFPPVVLPQPPAAWSSFSPSGILAPPPAPPDLFSSDGSLLNVISVTLGVSVAAGAILLFASFCLLYVVCRSGRQATAPLRERARRRYAQMKGADGMTVIVECTGTSAAGAAASRP